MTTDVEYALLAGAVYESSRDPTNRIPLPTGWTFLNKDLATILVTAANDAAFNARSVA
jgi:hypothetical protein